ncbi:MAG: hypothetical protein WBQ55_17435, partial [Xanthobacteraceae bacterium]
VADAAAADRGKLSAALHRNGIKAIRLRRGNRTIGRFKRKNSVDSKSDDQNDAKKENSSDKSAHIVDQSENKPRPARRAAIGSTVATK